MKATKYRNGIINSFQTSYSYGKLEGTHNNIKANKPMTHRYRHSCHFCDRIYLI
ncbi:transposase [Serratia marcescens]|nr:transposase [Serratia marcescens]